MSTRFQNRQSQYPNRKKISIISQTSGEMIADITRSDEATVEGTSIDASILNAWDDDVSTAKSNASTALSNSISAGESATTALSNSTTALSNSTEALNKAVALENAVADRGATVYVNNVAQSSISFTTDPQSQINAKLTKNFIDLNSKTTLSNNDTLVVQDSSSMNTPQDNCKISWSSIRNQILNAVYPIGSIYMSVSANTPDSLFGGVWTQLENRFLLGAGSQFSAGATKDGTTQTLTVNQLPAHKHENTLAITATQSAHRHGIGSPSTSYYYTECCSRAHTNAKGGLAFSNIGNYTAQPLTFTNTDQAGQLLMEAIAPSITVEHTLTNVNTGLGQAFSIMPPYLVVYMWKRVS